LARPHFSTRTVRSASAHSESFSGLARARAYAVENSGVAVLLPATQWFTRVVERLLPSGQTPLQRALDPSVLVSPVVAIESARRVVADVLMRAATSVSSALSGGDRPAAADGADSAAALEEVRSFLSELKEPLESDAEQHRMTSLLHALDHASRLADVLAEGTLAGRRAVSETDPRSAELCAKAMVSAEALCRSIAAESALSGQAEPIGWSVAPGVSAALAELEETAGQLAGLRRAHRAEMLASVAPGQLSAADAFARIDSSRQLDRIAHHIWRAAAHLFGRGGRPDRHDPNTKELSGGRRGSEDVDIQRR
jgi:phosphate:Na+ symporter